MLKSLVLEQAFNTAEGFSFLKISGCSLNSKAPCTGEARLPASMFVLGIIYQDPLPRVDIGQCILNSSNCSSMLCLPLFRCFNYVNCCNRTPVNGGARTRATSSNPGSNRNSAALNASVATTATRDSSPARTRASSHQPPQNPAANQNTSRNSPVPNTTRTNGPLPTSGSSSSLPSGNC